MLDEFVSLRILFWSLDMLIRVFIVFFGLTLLLADPADAYARKKRRVYKNEVWC